MRRAPAVWRVTDCRLGTRTMHEFGRLAVIGAGAMGSAIARGVIAAGLFAPDRITMADVDESRLAALAAELGVETTSDNARAVSGAGAVVIAVKPGMVSGVLAGIRGAVSPSHLVISFAAGVRLDSIENGLPEGAGVVRAMPNTPCLIGAGATGYSRGSAATDAQAALARKLFEAVGMAVEVPESLMEAVTGLSGSGPAYIYLMIEAMSDAGVRVGLPRDIALKLAGQTVLGAARMVVETGEHPARLKDQVTSPGGTTIAAIDVLEHSGFRSALMEAVKAAAKRAEELSGK